jgi:hypothetical protein
MVKRTYHKVLSMFFNELLHPFRWSSLRTYVSIKSSIELDSHPRVLTCNKNILSVAPSLAERGVAATID